MHSQYRDKATWDKSNMDSAGIHFTCICCIATKQFDTNQILSVPAFILFCLRSSLPGQSNLTQIKCGQCCIHFTWIRSFTNKVQVIQLKSYKYFLRSIVWLISSTSARCSNRRESYAWTLTQPKLYWFYRQFIGSLNWACLLWTPVPSRSTCRSRGGDLNWWTPRSRSGRQTKPPLWQYAGHWAKLQILLELSVVKWSIRYSHT